MFLFLPAGFLGLVVAGTLAAYRSTIETHLNWGTSYLVHDFYRRFLKQGQDEKHYVLMGRITTALLMVCAASLTFALDTAKEAFDPDPVGGRRHGAHLPAALVLVADQRLERGGGDGQLVPRRRSGSSSPAKLGYAVPALPVARRHRARPPRSCGSASRSSPRPTDHATLLAFYKLVRPAGPGWRAIRAEAAVGGSPDRLSLSLLGWVLGCVFVYSGLFGVGSFLYGRTPQALAFTVFFGVSALGLTRLLPLVWGQGSAES